MLWKAILCDGRRDGDALGEWAGHGLPAKMTVLKTDRAESPNVQDVRHISHRRIVFARHARQLLPASGCAPR
jgi:hypothetical protein